MIAALERYWADARLRDHAAVPHGARRRHVQSGDVPALPRARALAGRLRRAVDPPDRRPLRREPVPLPALLPVPGDPQAGARRRARPLLRLARGDRDRPRARTTCASSRTTGRARRSAPGASAGRSGSTGWRSTQFTYFQQLGGLELDLVPAEITYGLERLAMFLQGKSLGVRPRVGAGGHLGRRLPGERAPVVGLQLRGGAGRRAHAAVRRVRGGVPASRRAPAAAAGLRPGAEVLAHVQPARRARRDLGHRAGRLHRPRPRPGARRSPSLVRGSCMPTLLLEIGCEELPASACREAAEQLPELCEQHLGSARRTCSSGRGGWRSSIDDLPEADDAQRVGQGPAANSRLRRRGQADEGGRGLRAQARRRGRRAARAPTDTSASCAGRHRRHAAGAARGASCAGSRSASRCSGQAGGLRFARPVRWLCAKLDAETVTVELERRAVGGELVRAPLPAGEVEIATADVLRRGAARGRRRAGRRRAAAADHLDGLDAIGGWSDPAACSRRSCTWSSGRTCSTASSTSGSSSCPSA